MSVLADLAPAEGDDTDVLQRVAVALNSSLELRDVLRVLAEIGLEATGADRASVLLLDGDRLEPAVAIAHQPDDGLWVEFRGMPGVPLDGLRSELLAAGRAVVVQDARLHPLVPPGWSERFSLRSLVVVPLVAAGEPCGVIALDWSRERRFDDAAELRLLETIGAFAGVAVSNARLFAAVRRRAQLQEALARAGASLGSPLAPPAIADRLVDAYTDLLGTRLAAVALFDLDRRFVTSVASRGADAVATPLALDTVPEPLVAHMTEAWARAHGAIDIGHDPWLTELLGGDDVGVAWYLLLPLVVDGHTSGVAVLGFAASTRLDREEVEAAEALAAIAAAALERHALVERLDAQLRRIDALHRVAAALTEGAGATELVDRLNELLAGHGVDVVGVTFRDRRLAKHLGGDEPTSRERDAWRRGAGPVELDDGVLAVPMRLGRRLVGMLRVRPKDVGADERAFLEALAAGLAEVANRGVAHAEADETARRRAVEEERDRIRADLHDTAGQIFVALGLLAARHAEQLPAASIEAQQALRIADVAADGKWAIDQAIRALAFVPDDRRGLLVSLQSLAQRVSADSGIDVRCRSIGDTARLDGETERALFRVASEAVSNAWRHGRPSTIDIVLEASAAEVAMSVIDDGVGLAGSVSESSGHRGIAGMRRAATAVGGTVRVCDGEAGGTVVSARVTASR